MGGGLNAADPMPGYEVPALAGLPILRNLLMLSRRREQSRQVSAKTDALCPV